MRKLFLALSLVLLVGPLSAAERPEPTHDRPVATAPAKRPSGGSRPTARPPSRPTIGSSTSSDRHPVAAPASPTPPVPITRTPSREPSHGPVTTPSPGPIVEPGKDQGYEPSRSPAIEPPKDSGMAPSRAPAIGTLPTRERVEAEAAKPGRVLTPTVTEPLTRPHTRPFEGTRDVSADTMERHGDHRFDRPHPGHMVVHPDAHHPPPSAWYYQPWYGSWWVHPYYRWMHSTIVIVDFPFVVWPWDVMWMPPSRYGWIWVPGQWFGPYWYPGHWEPMGPPPVYYGASYSYVPGFWWDDYYYEGYWRVADRPGWVWVDTYYVGRRPVWGHWEPVETPRRGYVWEPGYWDGNDWVEGFWRPESRVGYRWVSAAWDRYGVFHAGYWEPIEPVPGHVWIPGWFDGNRWVPGYWVSEGEYSAANPEAWTPEPGWDAGLGEAPGTGRPVEEGAPLAIPVP